ncbi:MAG TPA: tRNA pseudouridine synthase A [Phycisphaerae bacterium]|nr:tRNA pseudouridine synthase A [Phycisphaerae bacterium]
MPKDMSLIELAEVPLTFHATKSALSKQYRYRIHNAPGRPVENLTQNYSYHCWQALDMDAMREAASHWTGEHDFTSFASAGNARESNVRTIFSIVMNRVGPEIQIDIEGDGFLYKQVRNMVGTLCEIGRGKWTLDDAKRILDARDRTVAGPTAPARGLCLQWVRYDMANLPPPTAEMLERAARAQPPAGEAKYLVDQLPLESAPTAGEAAGEEEPCA